MRYLSAMQQAGYRIKTAYYFPKIIRLLGAIFSIFGLAMVWTAPIIGSLFLFITLVIFSTHYGFEIQLGTNQFREFVWVLGYKDGRKHAFKAAEFIFIQPGKWKTLSYTLKEKDVEGYEAYLKFEGRNEQLVIHHANKEHLVQLMRQLSNYLKVPIKDYSDGNPVII